MTIAWNDSAPIYRQLKDKVVAMMLDGILQPGEALPSVRQIAAEYQLNPITVSLPASFRKSRSSSVSPANAGATAITPASKTSHFLPIVHPPARTIRAYAISLALPACKRC